MARRSSIRTRLLALLLVPAAGLLGIAGMQLADSLRTMRQTADIAALAQVAQAERDLLHSLQIERTRSLEYVAQLAGGVPSGAPAPLQQARDAVQDARASLDATLAGVDLASIAPEVSQSDVEAQRALAALQPLRFNLDAGRAEGQNVLRAFDDPIAALLEVDQRVIALIDQPAVRDDLQGSLAISQIKDAAIRSGDAVLLAASGAITRSEATLLLTEAQADRDTWLHVAESYLEPSQVQQVVDAQIGLPSPAEASTAAGGDPSAAMADTTERSAVVLRQLEAAATDSALSAATTAREDAVVQVIVVAIIAGVVLAVGLLLIAVLLRVLVDPLRQLTALADRVRTTLPETVEHVAGGGQAEASPFDAPEAVALTGRADELGELARAIRASTDEATRVAADQAATRAGVARTIEDVARREQTLVERQLSLLDQLEDAEEDPDQLAQLFRLDHLATRMRRNAENLLLLASGRLPGGQDATPVPLVDVVRTAAAEIEQYARVDVRVGITSTVVGYAATPLSHLLAELIENATQFSPPTSRVAVTARAADTGVVVSIRDHGIGMSEPEIADARRKLAAPPLLEAAESRRLGLYVVGLIAGRIGISVDLHPGDAHEGDAASGVVVDVLLPAHLFLGADGDTGADPGAGDAVARDGGDRITRSPAPATAPLALPPADVPARVPARPLADLGAAAEPAPRPAALPQLDTAPDALSEMRQLLDAQPATPPALPSDVLPPRTAGLPNRRDSLPRRDAMASGSGISLSAASGGRTVDLDYEAVGQLMASLSEDAVGDEVPPEPSWPARTEAALPAFPPAPPVTGDGPDWSRIDVDGALAAEASAAALPGHARPVGGHPTAGDPTAGGPTVGGPTVGGPAAEAADPAPRRGLSLRGRRGDARPAATQPRRKPAKTPTSTPTDGTTPAGGTHPNTNGRTSSWSTPFPPGS